MDFKQTTISCLLFFRSNWWQLGHNKTAKKERRMELEQEKVITNVDQAACGNNAGPIIELKNVTKTFETKAGQVEALRDINLSVMTGEIFGIIGLSGAGKSTLVRCINLLEKPTEGQVIFDGKKLLDMKRGALNATRREIAMVFQQFNLLMQRTALENICFPLEIAGTPKKEARERAMELLEVVDLVDRAGSYPSQLSGGQKQRVAIARALATRPKVLLCDEATSALDPKTTRSILALLKEINQKFGITIVIITHEMSVIQQICQRVAIIEKGDLAEIGSVSDIFSQPKSQAAKRLVLPDGNRTDTFRGTQMLRIVFDGRNSYEPVISNMVLACQAPVNIIYANTQNIEGMAVGQMIIQLPDNELEAAKQINYLKSQDVKFEQIEEVGIDV